MNRFLFFVFAGAVVLFCCHEQKQIPIKIILPQNEKAQVIYRSYVTDRNNELLHIVEEVERRFIRTDTSGQKITSFYMDHGNLLAFTFDGATLWNEVKIDLSALALNAGYLYDQPVLFSYFKPIYKTALQQTWRFTVDTVFSARDSNGTRHELQYLFSGTARHDADLSTFVPASSEPILAQNIYWPSFQSKIYDRTAGDTVWVQKGEARELFDPRLGLVRSLSNFTLQKKGTMPVFQKSTFELKLLILPEGK